MLRFGDLPVIIDTLTTWIKLTNCYWEVSENITKFIIKATIWRLHEKRFLGSLRIHWNQTNPYIFFLERNTSTNGLTV